VSTLVQPPPVIVYRESHGTSPEPGPTYKSVKVGPEAEPPIFTLPSGVSLNHIVSAVHHHHGRPISEITEKLIDRPLWAIPDGQREALHSLLTLSTVSYKECARDLLQKVQDVQVEWQGQEKVGGDQFQKYQEDVKFGVQRFLGELTKWYILTPEFTRIRYDAPEETLTNAKLD